VAGDRAGGRVGWGDRQAVEFGQKFSVALTSLLTGFDRAGVVLGNVGFGIDVSARNHWMADVASTPSGPVEPPWTMVSPPLILAPEGKSFPLSGNAILRLDEPLFSGVPLGDPDKLHEAGQAFFGARDAVDALTNGLYQQLLGLFANNEAEDLRALNEFWDRIGGSNDTAILTALRKGCDELGHALLEFAAWITDTQNQIAEAIKNILEDILWGSILGLLLSFFTAGISEVVSVANAAGRGAELMVAVDGILTAAAVAGRATAIGAAAGGVIGVMTTAIDSTPDPNVSDTNPGQPSETQISADATELGDLAEPNPSQQIGAEREIKVRELTDGTIPSGQPGKPGLEVVRPNVGKTDVDVIGSDGSYIAVGGPAKAKNLARLGDKLGVLKWGAEQAGVSAKAYFEQGTPESALQLARRILGADNVVVFTR
jgi:hypothetical protein